MLLDIRCHHIDRCLRSSAGPKFRLLIHYPTILPGPMAFGEFLLQQVDDYSVPRSLPPIRNARRANDYGAGANAEKRLHLGVPLLDELDLRITRPVGRHGARDQEVVELWARLVRVRWHNLDPSSEPHWLERVGDVVCLDVDGVWQELVHTLPENNIGNVFFG